jgi:RNA polymerase sigma-B factor
MRIDVRRLGEADLIIVAGTLDLATTPRLRAVLDARLSEGRRELVLDLDAVTFLDARAAGTFAGVAGRAHRSGGRLTAVGARGINADVLSLSGLKQRLQLDDEPAMVAARYATAGTGTDAPFEPRPELAERWPGSRDITAHALLAAAAGLPAGGADREQLRTQVIEDGLGLAQRLARRFRDRGEPIDDLMQVASMGLVHAVDGYDPGRGCEFVGYATPTILGEIRRYFRDKGWRIKVPRRLQELRIQVNRARVELSQTMAAEPGVADLARHLDVDPEEVGEAIEVARVYQPVSLSTPAGPDPGIDLADPLGADDPAIEAVDNREAVKPLLASLPERERRIVALRFFGEMTQSQIARELGISQMHVSRLLTQTLTRLREQLVA